MGLGPDATARHGLLMAALALTLVLCYAQLMSDLKSAAPQLDAALLDRLLAADDELPAELRQELLGMGSKAVPGLLSLLQADSRVVNETSDSGWTRVHAATLLGELGETVAIAPLLLALAPLDDDDDLYGAIADALPRFGEAMLEPVLQALDASASPVVRDALCSALSHCGVRDERIFARLESLVGEVPDLGANLLADYGDPRGRALIEEQFRSAEHDEDPNLALCVLDELIQAYHRMAGDLPDELVTLVQQRREELKLAQHSWVPPDGELDEPLTFEVVRRLENRPEQTWLWSATCNDSECDCRSAQLIVGQTREEVMAMADLVSDSWHADDAPAEVPPELRSVAAVEIDLDEGTLSVPDWAPANAMVGAMPQLVDGRFLDELHEQWLQGKGLVSGMPSPEHLNRLSEWKRGNHLAHDAAFEHSRLDCYAVGDASYILVDHHCPEPDCTCNQVILDWHVVGGDGQSVGTADWRPGAPPTLEGENQALTRDLWDRFVERYPNFEERLRRRSREIQEVGSRLLAKARARRAEAKARPWVPRSKKGRRGAGKG